MLFVYHLGSDLPNQILQGGLRNASPETVVLPLFVDGYDANQMPMYADGPVNTIVGGINTRDPDTVKTSFRAVTFAVMGKGFICEDMGFTAPADITRAPPLLVLSDHAAFFNRTTDGIKDPGFVMQNCTITAQEESTNSLSAITYLGSPCNKYSRTIIMESFLGEVIHPKGWYKWSDNYGIETAPFLEYNNKGPGARTDKRVRWYGYHTIFQRDQMVSYTAARFIQADQWLQSAGIPYESGFVLQK
ncbi:hypothetical protein VNO77_18233 [Canavalia gladiata]|uniref:Pectinesterase catalytic domain-containing protein n=1 Tax=Canavalia gladiata TaxID=3824 RepID=A0AAN9LP16_CANGL